MYCHPLYKQSTAYFTSYADGDDDHDDDDDDDEKEREEQKYNVE